MFGPPVSSSGSRFLRILGFSLVQALLFGSLVGLLVYFRVPHAEVEEDLEEGRSPLQWLWSRLEAAELWTYDWRVRQLGKASQGLDSVVMVAIDDETLANARKDEHAPVAIQPWPRDLVGGVVERLFVEGASLVILDLPFSDLGPRLCSASQGTGNQTDDDALRAFLERHPGLSVLEFSWREAKGPPTGNPTRPFLVFVDRRPSAAAAYELARRILGDRHPAFIIPDGRVVQVWAGVASEDEGRQLATRWDVRGTASVRELSPAERAFQVTPLDLLLAEAEVQVAGLDPSALPRARSIEQPIAALLGHQSLYGASNVALDADGRVRGLPLLSSYAGPDSRLHLLPSAPLAAAMQLAGTRQLRYEGGRLKVGDRLSVPMDESGYALLRWDAPEGGRDGRGPLKRTIPAWRLVVNLFDQKEGLPPHYRNDLNGRTVVLTRTTTPAIDFVVTPIGQVAGGAVLAQGLANLLQSGGIRRAGPRMDLLATLGMAFAGAFLAFTFGGARSRPGRWFFLATLPLAAAAYGWEAWRVFEREQLWVAVAGPWLALTATFVASSRYVSGLERRLGEFIRALLGQSVRPRVAGQVARNPALMRPDRRQVTVFFGDLERFTELSERLLPEQLVMLLREYLTEMTAVVHETGGQVDHYVGDTLSAFWGAPLRTDRHAHQACEAALRMREVLARRQEGWEERFGHRLDFRIGLNTGEVVVGDMGSELEPNYTVLGDAVGLATRLERECGRYGTLILVGEATARAASDGFWFREVDRIRVRGKTMPIQIFELVGRRKAGQDRPADIALFEKGLLLYYERRFPEALELFSRGAADHGDKVAEVFARRCDRYLASPPPANWDGVTER